MGDSGLAMINRARHNLFTSILHVTQIEHLVRNNYWADIVYKKEKVFTRELKLNSSKSDFTFESMDRFYNVNDLTTRIIVALEKGERNHNVVFVPGVDNAISIAEKLDHTEALYSELPKKQRFDIINRFKEGSIKTIINCNILSLGFNYPELDHVIMARPTNSFAVYYQQLGRGVRKHETKKNLLVTDLSKNIDRFGTIENITFEKDIYDRWGMFNTNNKGKKIKLTYHDVDLNALGYDNKMLWGPYKGRDLSEVPLGQLEWTCKNYSTTKPNNREFVNACQKEINRRKHE